MDPGGPEEPDPQTTMIDTGSHDSSAAAQLKAANRRTALTLLSIALVFFVGVIATHFAVDATTGIAVIGSAVLLFLVVAIGRTLRVRGGSGSQDPDRGGPPPDAADSAPMDRVGPR